MKKFCTPKSKMLPRSTICLVTLTFLAASFAPPTLAAGGQQPKRLEPAASVVEQQAAPATVAVETSTESQLAGAKVAPLPSTTLATTEQATISISSLGASATPFPPIASLQIEPAPNRASSPGELSGGGGGGGSGGSGVGSWIERILIQVEELNERQAGARTLANSSKTNSNDAEGGGGSGSGSGSGDNDDAAQEGAPSLMGADCESSAAAGEGSQNNNSTEDKGASADNQTTTTTTSVLLLEDKQQNASTQYSLASAQSGAGAATLSSSSSIGWPTSGGQAPQEAFDEDEQRLVESNNVSAVLLEPQSTSRPILAITTVGPRQPVGCEQAYTHCALRKVCAPALKAYNDDCQDLINNRTSQCSPKCLKAMIALRSSEEGDDLVNCDCQGHEYCEHSKLRSQACKPQVEQAVDPKTVVACSTASWICMADQLCSTALEFYYRNCQSLFSQGHCSMRCNNSLSILYRQPKASKLINCYCDGSEEFPCVKYKTYTERFCLNKLTVAGIQLEATSSVSSQEDVDANVSETEEDDTLNLTNDPETTFGGGGGGSLSASSFVADGDEEEYDDPKAASGGGIGTDTEEGQSEESLSAASLNGIQTAEDNWIPLMSGRFFTNLHHQQQQQQRIAQQQQQQQQQNLRLRQGDNNRQNGRKAPKATKQKTKSNSSSANHNHHHETATKRNRYASRLHMLATTSSAITCNGPWTVGMLLVTIWITIVVVVVDDIYSSGRLI